MAHQRGLFFVVPVCLSARFATLAVWHSVRGLAKKQRVTHRLLAVSGASSLFSSFPSFSFSARPPSYPPHFFLRLLKHCLFMCLWPHFIFSFYRDGLLLRPPFPRLWMGRCCSAGLVCLTLSLPVRLCVWGGVYASVRRVVSFSLCVWMGG